MRARIGQEFRIRLSDHQPRFPSLEKLHRIDQGTVDPPQERDSDKAPCERQFDRRRAAILIVLNSSSPRLESRRAGTHPDRAARPCRIEARADLRREALCVGLAAELPNARKPLWIRTLAVPQPHKR